MPSSKGKPTNPKLREEAKKGRSSLLLMSVSFKRLCRGIEHGKRRRQGILVCLESGCRDCVTHIHWWRCRQRRCPRPTRPREVIMKRRVITPTRLKKAIPHRKRMRSRRENASQKMHQWVNQRARQKPLLVRKGKPRESKLRRGQDNSRNATWIAKSQQQLDLPRSVVILRLWRHTYFSCTHQTFEGISIMLVEFIRRWKIDPYHHTLQSLEPKFACVMTYIRLHLRLGGTLSENI